MTPKTEHTARLFLERINSRYDLAGAILFGSQARKDARPDSDTDLAVVLKGHKGRRVEVALTMADVAFDVLLETGVMIEALPIWEEEWQHPETFNNPALLENIRREGVWL